MEGLHIYMKAKNLLWHFFMKSLKAPFRFALITADGRDLVFVEVDVVDAEGVLVPRADNLIDFAVDGPGALVGVDNGDATSHESYKGNSRSAFSGKVMAIVQSTGEIGSIVVRASASGLSSGEAEVSAR
jgi:beta-galactosidase